MNTTHKHILATLCKKYDITTRNTIHELRKKIWDAPVYSDADMDIVQDLEGFYPNEEPIEDLIA